MRKKEGGTAAFLCGTELLLSLETVCTGVSAGVGDRGHDLFNIGLDVGGRILKVIIHDVVGVETELGRLRGLLGVVNDEELVRAIVLGKVNAVGAESVLDPELCSIGVSRAL